MPRLPTFATVLIVNFIFSSGLSFQGEYGSSCNSTQLCKPDLNCVDQKCQCRFPKLQVYMEATSECVSMVGGPCSYSLEDGTVVQYGCVKSADCQDVDGLRECVCKSGFLHDSEGYCLATYGLPCENTEDCHQYYGPKIQCEYDKCGCPSLQIFDEEIGRCIGLVGSTCRDNYFDESTCIDGAECVEFGSSYYICRCVPPYVTTPGRKCEQP